MGALLKKFVRYSATGGFAALTDAAIFMLCLFAKLALIPSACLSFCAAAFINYKLTSRYVFGGRAPRLGFSAFLLAAFFGLSINVIMTVGCLSLLEWPPIWAKIAGTATAFSMNFLVNFFIVFAR
jgi:putative flippase GtrA